MTSPLLTLKDLQTLLDGTVDPAWADADGNSLLHYAARFGDKETVEQCFALGVKALVFNNEDECARDAALVWGYDDIASIINTRMESERESTPPSPIGYASLVEIRLQSAAKDIDVFQGLAKRGQFEQLLLLAQQDAEGLTVQDYLEKGSSGMTLLLEVCEQGQVSLLIKPELWMKNPSDFMRIWENIPTAYRPELDAVKFMNAVRQMKLKTVPGASALKRIL